MQSKCAYVGFNYGEENFTCQDYLAKKMGISERLKEERNRLGLTQPAMAELIGTTKRSIINWEGGTGSPNAEAMSAIAAAGADVQYILTGVRAGGAIAQASATYTVLSRREAALVDNYRHIADEGDKRVVERAAQMAAEATKDETQSARVAPISPRSSD